MFVRAFLLILFHFFLLSLFSKSLFLHLNPLCLFHFFFFLRLFKFSLLLLEFLLLSLYFFEFSLRFFYFFKLLTSKLFLHFQLLFLFQSLLLCDKSLLFLNLPFVFSFNSFKLRQLLLIWLGWGLYHNRLNVCIFLLNFLFLLFRRSSSLEMRLIWNIYGLLIDNNSTLFLVDRIFLSHLLHFIHLFDFLQIIEFVLHLSLPIYFSLRVINSFFIFLIRRPDGLFGSCLLTHVLVLFRQLHINRSSRYLKEINYIRIVSIQI